MLNKNHYQSDHAHAHHAEETADPCVVCRRTQILPNQTLYVRGYHHKICQVCGSIYVGTQLTPSVVNAVYQKESGYLGGTKVPRASAKLWKLAVQVNSKVESVLDVGCGSGRFLSFLPEHIDKHGCDPSKHLVLSAREKGLTNVQLGTLETLDYEEGSFDMINLGDVIEHTQDVRKMLADAHRILTAGGVLALSTPDMQSNWARVTLWLWHITGIPPSVLTPPQHLTNLSKTAVAILLEEHGFRLVHYFSERATLRYELIQVAISLGWPPKSFRKGLWLGLVAMVYPLLWAAESVRFAMAGCMAGKEARFIAVKSSVSFTRYSV